MPLATHGSEDLSHLIFDLSPTSTPLEMSRPSKRTLSRASGGSMRKQRRRKARPVRFTAAHGPLVITIKDGKHLWSWGSAV